MQKSLPEAKLRAIELRKLITKANFSYFNGVESGKEGISENIRDQLKQELIDLEAQFPEIITKNSPTQRVGAPLAQKAEKVPHKSRKWSLSDAFDEEEVKKFAERMEKELGKKPIYTLEPKIDGINVTIWYEKGEFARALTRGNGQIGEDISHSIRTSASVPLRLPKPLDLEVTGEAYMTKKDFERVIKEGKEDFANPRNLVAGTVRSLDPKVAQNRPIRLSFYAIGDDNLPEIKTQAALFDFFEEMHLPHQKILLETNNVEKLNNYIAQKSSNKEWRNAFPYEIDGLVIKVANLEARRGLGHTAKAVRWAVAYKFPPEEVYTKLLDVHFQLGRTGALTPVAQVSPVLIAGSTISRAVLHNASEIKNKDLKIGDTVIIRKAGDIIPEIVKPITDLRTGSEKTIVFPANCPYCDDILQVEELKTSCINQTCPEKAKKQAEYAIKQLQIDGLGTKSVLQLFEKGIVKDWTEIYGLESADLAMLDGFKQKKIENAIKEIAKAKTQSAWRILAAFGVDLIGVEGAKLICETLKVENLEDFLILEAEKADLTEKLNNVHGIGEKMAESFAAWAADEKTKQKIDYFRDKEVKIEQKKSSKITNEYEGMTFCITGSFENQKREDIAQKVTQKGGKVVSSVSKNLHVLLMGENAGSKYEKAQNLGVTIWNAEKMREQGLLESEKNENLQEEHNEPQSSLF